MTANSPRATDPERPRLLAALLCLLALLIANATAGEPAKGSLAPLFGVAGNCVLQPDLTSEKLDGGWRTITGQWEVKDGALRGLQIPEQNHAAVLRHDLAVRDLIAEIHPILRGLGACRRRGC